MAQSVLKAAKLNQPLHPEMAGEIPKLVAEIRRLSRYLKSGKLPKATENPDEKIFLPAYPARIVPIQFPSSQRSIPRV
ncbi:MAG: hypothetical protein AAF570_08095, partial [Bacteroidota bacterium]